MGRFENLKGLRFNKLVVIEKTNEKDKSGSIIWLCKCDCGNTIKLSTSALKRPERKSCGCLVNKFENLEGKTFGRLFVEKFLYIDKKQHTGKYLCKCDCGKEKNVTGIALKSGKTKSCGCLRKEIVHNKKIIFEEDTRLYNIWSGMKSRCKHKNLKCAKYYYNKNIKVCEEWLNWGNFKTWAINNGYKDNLTIDRINGDGNYEPSNCRWATYLTQANNTSQNKILTFNGKSLTLAQWSREVGIKAGTINQRLYRGWSVKKALTTPLII